MGGQCSCEKAPAGGSRGWIDAGSPTNASKGGRQSGRKATAVGSRNSTRPSGDDSPRKKLKIAIKQQCTSRKDAWKKLDVSNDARIDKLEFERFLIDDVGLESADLIKQVFEELDHDNDGVISAMEFKELYDDDAAEEVPAIVLQVRSQVVELFANQSEAFGKINVSKKGWISKQELRNFMVKDLGLSAPQNTLDLFDVLDTDHDGKISADEFRACFDSAWAGVDNTRAALGGGRKKGLEHFREFMKSRFAGAKAAFAHLDKDNDRALNREELKKVLREMGYTGDGDAVFDALDADNDGSVTREEFKYQLKLVMRAGRAQEGAAAGA